MRAHRIFNTLFNLRSIDLANSRHIGSSKPGFNCPVALGNLQGAAAHKTHTHTHSTSLFNLVAKHTPSYASQWCISARLPRPGRGGGRHDRLAQSTSFSPAHNSSALCIAEGALAVSKSHGKRARTRCLVDAKVCFAQPHCAVRRRGSIAAHLPFAGRRTGGRELIV